MNLLSRLTASACILLALAAGTAKASVEQRLSFDVFLDGDQIGSHVFQFEQSDSAQRVDIQAAFDVTVLFVPVYSYRHSNTEVWRGGCLQEIRSETDANGKRFAVRGKGLGDAFQVETGSNSRLVDADCVMSFAYWDRDILNQQRLLNAQTGELIDVEIEALGLSTVTIAGEATTADAYRISAPADGVDIRVYYAPGDGRWLALESIVDGGRVMRYEPTFADDMAAAAWRGR
jgi:hypothetical protein